MEIISQSQARKELFNIAKRVNKNHVPIAAVSKDSVNDIVIMSRKDFDALQETLYIYGIPGMKEKIDKSEKEKTIPFISLQDLPTERNI